MTVAGVVAAAGRGERLGADRPKALVEVGGRALVAHAVDRLAAGGVGTIVVVHPPGGRDRFAAACDGRRPDALVLGGDTRGDSVRAGLAAVAPDADTVAVHDAARGLCPASVVADALAALEPPAVAVAPGRPVADTLKRVRGGRVVETVDRRGLWLAQTPQVFDREVLEAATGAGGTGATDDLGLVEAALAGGEVSGQVRLVRGAPEADKITEPGDLRVARALAAAGGGPS